MYYNIIFNFVTAQHFFSIQCKEQAVLIYLAAISVVVLFPTVSIILCSLRLFSVLITLKHAITLQILFSVSSELP